MATQTTNPTAAGEVMVPIITEYIAIKPGHCGGKPHVAGHRIKVQHIAIWHERMGMTAAEIVATHPTLSLSAVHAALAYYHAHRSEIDADIDADETFVAEMRAKAGASLLKEKLGRLRGTDDSLPPG